MAVKSLVLVAFRLNAVQVLTWRASDTNFYDFTTRHLIPAKVHGRAFTLEVVYSFVDPRSIGRVKYMIWRTVRDAILHTSNNRKLPSRMFAIFLMSNISNVHAFESLLPTTCIPRASCQWRCDG